MRIEPISVNRSDALTAEPRECRGGLGHLLVDVIVKEALPRIRMRGPGSLQISVKYPSNILFRPEFIRFPP